MIGLNDVPGEVLRQVYDAIDITSLTHLGVELLMNNLCFYNTRLFSSGSFRVLNSSTLAKVPALVT